MVTLCSAETCALTCKSTRRRSLDDRHGHNLKHFQYGRNTSLDKVARGQTM